MDGKNDEGDEIKNTVEVLENRVNSLEEEIEQLKAEKRELTILVNGLGRELENVIEYLSAKRCEN